MNALSRLQLKKNRTNYLGLALLFTVFAGFSIRLAGSDFGVIDQIALFVFGALAGANIVIYLMKRPSEHHVG